MKIGVFDSGIGGKSVAESLEKEFPNAEVLYVNDREHVPYGSRYESEIISLTDDAIQPLLSARCDVIVIACNTATAAAIEVLRKEYTTTVFVGLEPMVKTAVELTKTGMVAICATPYTLKSQRYTKLKNQFAQNIDVLEPDCSDWASMIEHSSMQEEKIKTTIDEICEAGADVIVLACTHYHWIKENIERYVAGRAVVIDPSEAISRRIRQVTESKSLVRE